MIKQWLANRKKYKMRFEMIFVNASISILPVILIGFIFYNMYLDSVRKNVSDSVDILFDQVNSRLEEYFDNINQLSQTAFYNKSLQNLLTNGDMSYWEKSERIAGLFQPYLDINDSIRLIGIIDPSQKLYVAESYRVKGEILNYLESVDPAAMQEGKLNFSGRLQASGSGKAVDEILAFRQVKSISGQSYLDTLCIGVMVLDMNKINEIIKGNNLSASSEIYIVDSNQQMIVGTGRELFDEIEGRRLSEGIKRIEHGNSEYLLKTSSVNKVGWRLVANIHMERLIKEGNVLKYSVPVLVLLIFISVIIVTLAFNIRVTLPIKKMADAFDRVARGDFKFKLTFKHKNEITYVEDHFNHMIDKIDNLTNHLLSTQEQLYENELQKKQFQLNGLQAQINAHFLYNTLHSIRGMALTGAKHEVNTIIENLVDYFRYITRMDDFVTFKEEIEHLKKYLVIQKLRFGHRFNVIFDIDQRVQPCSVLKLTLQPLVENSIFHGLEQKSGKGSVKISIHKMDEGIQLKVLDNGKGIEPRRVLRLQEALLHNHEKKTGRERRGVGLINIHKRIQIHCGPQYGLQVKSWVNRGTVVAALLPCVMEGDEQNV